MGGRFYAKAIVFQFLHRIPRVGKSTVVRRFAEFFQFLHRIPHKVPGVTGITTLLRLSIPSPDSTWVDKMWREAVGYELSIPSPDSTTLAHEALHLALLTFQFLHRIPLTGTRHMRSCRCWILSIPSPDSTISPRRIRQILEELFQFLHRIPLTPETISKITGVSVFQFLHRIPLIVNCFVVEKATGTFNSFTGFHNSHPTYVSRSLTLIFQFLHRIPQNGHRDVPSACIDSLSIPSPDSTDSSILQM